MTKASNTQTIKRLIAKPSGATLESLCAKTGWQPHSVRAFLSGLRKEGAVVDRDGRGKGAKYRMTSRAEIGNDKRS